MAVKQGALAPEGCFSLYAIRKFANRNWQEHARKTWFRDGIASFIFPLPWRYALPRRSSLQRKLLRQPGQGAQGLSRLRSANIL
jgi:hypothetical protein